VLELTYHDMPILHHHIIDKLAIATGVASGLALYPQVYLVITSASADNVSITTYAIILVNSIVWLVYSIHRDLLLLAIPSVLNILASVAVIAWFITL